MVLFAAPIKVAWIINISFSWENVFYPSLVKKIQKSDPYFQEHFSKEMIDLDESTFKTIFLPLYEEQIVNRPDYHLNEEQTLNTLYENMQQYPYKLLAVYEKSSQNFVGGVVFSVRDTNLSIAYRAFNREISRKYKARTTLDYWIESYLFTYAVQMGKPEIRHGRDIFPREGRAIGLTTYKLTLGAKPHVDEDTELKEFDENTLDKTDQSLLFFTHPDTSGQLSKALLLHPTEEIDEIIKTLTALCSWSGIELEIKN